MPDFAVLTTFIATDVPDQSHGSVPESWKKSCALIRNHAGFMGGVIGRCVENPEKGMLITGWCSEQEYSEFKSGAGGQIFESELAKKSSSPVQAVQVDLLSKQMLICQSAIKGSAAELHTIEFPKGYRDSLGKKLAKIKGMVYQQNDTGIDGSGPVAKELEKRAYKGAPIPGWIVPSTPDDSNVDKAIWLHLWKSPEQERQFKDSEGRTRSGLLPGVVKEKDGSDERVWPTQDFFEQELKKLGALDMKIEHFEFGDFRLL
ncbi:hypothetical protein Q7P37_003692 [Cladosporium fusiforme]